MDALGINLGFLLVQIVNLIIVYVVVRKWIVIPITGMLEKRRETIAQGLEDARIAGEARANAEEEAARIIAEAESQALQILNQGRERADKAMVQIRAEAEQDIYAERQNVLADLQREHDQVLSGLRGEVAALAISAAQKLVGDALDEKRQHALLDEFFSGIKAGQVVVLSEGDLQGDTAEVTSALPLTDAEQKKVEQGVLAKSGAKEVSFRVDPSILGGLVIKVGDKVLDGSVAGKLGALKQNLG
ncbi:MAG: F0F1 ATP synthase subunit B [Anaerolineales bacterium]|nr:F0F1 ATP synthase subunit B [Anaerolineales bacterium]